MSVSERSIISQCIYVLHWSMIAAICLFIFADYMNTITSKANVSYVTQDNQPAGLSELLPLSSYTLNKDGDTLLCYGPR